ncbi:MAG: LexA family transcriptional regulator [Verrucomicrobiaceae bacterium]|nr:MAG: LexA family transcriptional regulator [Verrucomicrobiaceae bacterium]
MELPERVITFRQSNDLTQSDLAKILGISSNYVSLIENGQREPGEGIVRHFELLERAYACGLFGESMTSEDFPGETPPSSSRNKSRRVPVLGMAHAGEATLYEEIPKDWQDWVDTESRDEKAFGVRLEGESMAPSYLPNDVLILNPSSEIYSGCLAVLKLKTDGFVFRQIERRSDHLKLVPLNPRWTVEEIPLSEVEWVYPLFGMYRQVWKG